MTCRVQSGAVRPWQEVQCLLSCCGCTRKLRDCWHASSASWDHIACEALLQRPCERTLSLSGPARSRLRPSPEAAASTTSALWALDMVSAEAALSSVTRQKPLCCAGFCTHPLHRPRDEFAAATNTCGRKGGRALQRALGSSLHNALATTASAVLAKAYQPACVQALGGICSGHKAPVGGERGRVVQHA